MKDKKTAIVFFTIPIEINVDNKMLKLYNINFYCINSFDNTMPKEFIKRSVTLLSKVYVSSIKTL